MISVFFHYLRLCCMMRSIAQRNDKELRDTNAMLAKAVRFIGNGATTR
jgi:hypothetical protein